jgi:hypothetical protein
MSIIHAENLLFENIYVNSTDAGQVVGFDFSSLNVSQTCQSPISMLIDILDRLMAQIPFTPII